MVRTQLLLLAGLAARLMAQPDPSELLLRVRENVMRTVDRLPRYMCTQTIDRSQYEPDRQVFVKDCEELELSRSTRWNLLRTTSDRLRLDVGVSARREIYSWVGENQFGNRSLFEIVNEGSVSTGSFQGFLDLVFRSDHADFSYVREISEAGRNLMEYRYRVPLETSHYYFRSGGQSLTTAYEGTVLADPAAAELVRLTVRTSHMPSETGACAAATTMNYTRFRLNGSDFLLPSETILHIEKLNGVETENKTVSSGCHEFLGESTLKFEAPPDAPAPQTAAARAETAIPAGLAFGLALAEDIPIATAAAGEAVKAVLTAALRDESKKVLFPNHTPAVCRILRIRRYYYGRDASRPGMEVPIHRVELTLRLESVALRAGQRPVFAKMVAAVDGSRSRPGKLQSRPMELGQLNAMGRNLWSLRFERVGDSFVIKSGLPSNWVTVAP
jgi:hypothetical protein